MYTIFLLNFGYYIEFESNDLNEAMEKAVDIGYDAAICYDNEIVKIHRMIGGWS